MGQYNVVQTVTTERIVIQGNERMLKQVQDIDCVTGISCFFFIMTLLHFPRSTRKILAVWRMITMVALSDHSYNNRITEIKGTMDKNISGP